MPARFAATFALAFLLASVVGGSAAGLDPEQAAREARSELRSVLRKQRNDRTVPTSRQAVPTGSIGKMPSGSATPLLGKSPRPKSGNDLPTICIGCGAK